MEENRQGLRLNLQAAIRYTELAREKLDARGEDEAAAELREVADRLREVLASVGRG